MKYETTDEFLARGGKITYLPPRHYRENKLVYKESILRRLLDEE